MKIIKILFLMLFVLASSDVGSNTKVLVALLTTEADEPHLVESFIAGYESSGGKWKGIIKIDTSIKEDMFSSEMAYGYTNGFNLVLRNSGPGSYHSNDLDSFYNLGMQVVSGAGSNVFQQLCEATFPMPQHILCGAGNTVNMTGYYCEFFDIHPFSNYPITNLKQLKNDTLVISADTKNNGGFVVPPGALVNISGVSGYTSNPSGFKTVTSFVEDNSYSRFKIIYNLGSGSFTPGGNFDLYYQSYSHAYIAGKLAFIKDSLNCSWWEARYRMRMTASNHGTYDQYDGFGKPDVNAALAYTGEIIEDPFNKLGEMSEVFEVKRSGNKLTVKFGKVVNALKYNFYDNDKLIKSLPVVPGFSTVNITELDIPLTGSAPHNIWYEAVRGDKVTAQSKKIAAE